MMIENNLQPATFDCSRDFFLLKIESEVDYDIIVWESSIVIVCYLFSLRNRFVWMFSFVSFSIPSSLFFYLIVSKLVWGSRLSHLQKRFSSNILLIMHARTKQTVLMSVVRVWRIFMASLALYWCVLSRNLWFSTCIFLDPSFSGGLLT